MKNKPIYILITVLTISILIGMILFPVYSTHLGKIISEIKEEKIQNVKDETSTEDPIDQETNNEINKEKNIDTKPKYNGKISIRDVGNFTFEPERITTVRQDIFKPGYFSLFDILVNLSSIKTIDLEYHFDESMNTHVIDSINGMENWWYYAYYDGGWRESNAFRMDHYPYKDNTTIVLFQEGEAAIEDRYDVFTQEIAQKTKNGGKIIIPRVIISGPTNDLEFKNVEVTAHDLRADTFQAGIITAIDVIMSLGDQKKIEYELKWYETIGDAETVKNYWVHRINNDESYDTCGFVYEAGSEHFKYSKNHIHIPSDSRVINSPEYEEWFWICL